MRPRAGARQVGDESSLSWQDKVKPNMSFRSPMVRVRLLSTVTSSRNNICVARNFGNNYQGRDSGHKSDSDVAYCCDYLHSFFAFFLFQ